MVGEMEGCDTSNPLEQHKENKVLEDRGKSVYHDHPVELKFYSQPDIMTKKGKNEVGQIKAKGDSKLLELTVGKFERINRRFTRSIASLSIPKTMEQNAEPIFIEVYSDQEDESPPHENPLNGKHEKSSNYGNSLVSPEIILGDNSPLLEQQEYEVQHKTSLSDECSFQEALEAAKQSIILPLEHEINQLKDKLK